jgi:hypothetical protein
MATVYVLLMLMWVPSARSSGSIGSAEFSSLERCEQAAAAADKKFAGVVSSFYHVCVPK